MIRFKESYEHRIIGYSSLLGLDPTEYPMNPIKYYLDPIRVSKRMNLCVQGQQFPFSPSIVAGLEC
jgi:hypothetical protein